MTGTDLLISGHNDPDQALNGMTRWVTGNLACEIPMHFSAFYPACKMLDLAASPMENLSRAHRIVMDNGVRYAFTGNVFDPQGANTCCHQCGAVVIGRTGYAVTEWNVTANGACNKCRASCAGVLEAAPGDLGARSQTVRLRQ